MLRRPGQRSLAGVVGMFVGRAARSLMQSLQQNTHIQMRYTSICTFNRALLLPLAVVALLVAGCDSTTGVEPDFDTVTIQGRVTDDAGYGKQMDNVEGAVVTAASIRANGSLTEHDVEATTDVDGRFDLEVEPASDVLLLRASADNGFTSRALVYIDGDAVVRSMPLTTESTVEADVYLEARSEGHSNVRPAAVAAYVNAAMAAEVQSGAAEAAEVAAAVAAAIDAQRSFLLGQDGINNATLNAQADAEAEAFSVLQTQLNGAANASVEAAAYGDFYDALVESYTEAGVDLAAQAKARAAAAAALSRSSAGVAADVRVELRRQAMRLAALATAHSVEARFEASGASGATIDALADARADYVAEIDAATSINALADAADAYSEAVTAQLAATAELTAAQIDAAYSTIGAAAAALQAALEVASSAGAVANAYITFDTAATSALAAHFDDHAQAELAAAIILLMSV